ncbi:lasso peptide biosynthesis PqqD family chaperone [Metabacillus sp. cB07]|uniref:lasso peptide biosynthesis PqqD family chaperone n=1 Tax=Metabacillus sp. cB07 TaxID=2806989 RepID=UPI001939C24B|nr:lasso peptide biosynthesis PqqD family chaperone [Metabacillus sp. cB07]
MANSSLSTTNFTICQVEGNIVSNMNGETVMLSIQNGKYYNFGETGGAIWDLLKKPISFSALIEALILQYQVDREECEKQVLSFLDSLKKENLIIVNFY